MSTNNNNNNNNNNNDNNNKNKQSSTANTNDNNNNSNTQTHRPMPSKDIPHTFADPLATISTENNTSISFPPKSQSQRAIDIFSYPSNPDGLTPTTILPLPKAWKFIDMNMCIPQLTEIDASHVHLSPEDPYPTLKQSYDAPELILRIFQQPTDPEYNKFTQQAFVTPYVQDVQQLVALHELKLSWIYVATHDRRSPQIPTHITTIQGNFAQLATHVQQYLLQVLAPPPGERIVTHMGPYARYPGEDVTLGDDYLNNQLVQQHIAAINQFWQQAERNDYNNIRFKTDEQNAHDQHMDGTTSGEDTDGDNTAIINLMTQGAEAMRTDNVLADQMSGVTQDATGTNNNDNTKNKSKQKHNDKNTNKQKGKTGSTPATIYVPTTPPEILPIQPIYKIDGRYEKARQRQIRLEEIVDELHHQGKLDETKYKEVAQRVHTDYKNYKVRHARRDLTLPHFKKKKVRFAGSQYGPQRGQQYLFTRPKPYSLNSKHNYTDYTKNPSTQEEKTPNEVPKQQQQQTRIPPIPTPANSQVAQLQQQMQQQLQQLQQLQQQLQQQHQQSQKLLQNATTPAPTLTTTDQQFAHIARGLRPANVQPKSNFNNPPTEKDLAQSIEQMLNNNQLPPRQHTGVLPSDPVAAIKTPIPPNTPIENRYPTFMDNQNDIVNFEIDEIHQINHYIGNYDYHLNQPKSKATAQTAQQIALNTSLVLIFPLGLHTTHIQ